MKEIEFFDVKTKGKFKASEYRLVQKGNRNFVVAKSPNGPHECWKVVGKDMAAQIKKG